MRWDNPFWSGASANFARQASGYALAVLNGTRKNGALDRSSSFYRFELPQLNAARLRGLKVLLLHNMDREKYETCKEPKTLLELEAMLDEKNITYACEDDNFAIVMLMCSQDPYSRECQAIKQAIGFNSAVSVTSSQLALFILVSATVYSIH